jgi:hypothetical protein
MQLERLQNSILFTSDGHLAENAAQHPHASNKCQSFLEITVKTSYMVIQNLKERVCNNMRMITLTDNCER